MDLLIYIAFLLAVTWVFVFFEGKKEKQRKRQEQFERAKAELEKLAKRLEDEQ